MKFRKKNIDTSLSPSLSHRLLLMHTTKKLCRNKHTHTNAKIFAKHADEILDILMKSHCHVKTAAVAELCVCMCDEISSF
jgi:hypothetical protein